MAEILIYEMKRKDIMPRRNGRMGRKNSCNLNMASGIFVAHSDLNVLPDPFQYCEGWMAFIQMNHRMLDTQFIQNFAPANTKDDLLTQSLIQVPA